MKHSVCSLARGRERLVGVVRWAMGGSGFGAVLWCLWVLWAGPIQAPPASAPWVAASGEVAVQRAVWADPSGEATLQDALGQTFNPAPTIVARGYQTGATWLRVTVPAIEMDSVWVTVQPTYLDDVQVHSRPWLPDGTPGNWTMRQLGDAFPFAGKERRTLIDSIVLESSPTQSTVFYVRLRTTSTHALYVNVLTQASALEFEGQTLLGLGLYMGVVLVLTWISVVRFAVTRNTLWALNVLLQAGTVVLTVFYLGLPAKYLLPNAPLGVDRLMSSVLCGQLFLSVLYYTRLVAAFGAPRWAVRASGAFLLAYPWQLWLVWQGQAGTAMQLNGNLFLAFTLLGAVVVWLFKIEDVRLRRMVRLTFLVQTAYLLAFVLPLLGVGQMTLLHLYPALLVNLFGSVMQHLVLTRRDQLHRLAQRTLKREAEATRLQLQAKQWQLAETTTFVGMLLHELKNPLASVRLAVLNLLRSPDGLSPAQLKRLAHIQSAADGMDAVLDRCRQVDRLESGSWTNTQTPTDVAAQLADAVAQQAGHRRLALSTPPELVAPLDAHGFHTMAGNLLDNALAYSPPDSLVGVVLQAHAATATPTPPQRPAHLTLTVRNAVGKAGLPDASRVFDKYYRAQGAHQRTGSGLGLYLVKNLAEQAGGGISHWVETTPEGAQQAVFELWLPCP